MDTEFKEKTYEKYFGHELSRLTNITYSPDLCDEAILGFDEAFFLSEEWFLRFGPYVRRRRRGRRTGIDIERFNEWGKIVTGRLPPFRLNLFVQFKRPEYLTTRRAKQWTDWEQCYFRYKTTFHQQEALERIDEQSHGRAATVYASPAFWEVNDLCSFVRNETVVEHSNMAQVGKLKGHKNYSYVAPGFKGKGHSETVDIESQQFAEVIGTGIERGEPLPLNQHLKEVATTIIEATNNSDTVTPVFQNVQSAMGFEEFDPDSIYDAISIIRMFSDAFGVTYYAIG